MMMLKTFVVLASVAAALASNCENVGESDDTVALLQRNVEEKRAASKVAAVESDTLDEYNLPNPLECQREKAAVAPLEKHPETELLESLAEAPLEKITVREFLEQQRALQREKDAAAAAAASASDPPGADAIKAILKLMCFLLFLDGLRHCWKKQVATSSKDSVNEELVKEACVDEAALSRSWLELTKAASNGNVPAHHQGWFKQALSHKSLLTRADAWGCTALHFASVGGSANITAALLKHGAEVDAVDADEETSLHFAARGGHASTCEVLINAGAQIDAVNLKGLTPLVVAGQSNQEQVCRLLADLGAGVAGLADEDLPPLVVSQVVRKMFDAPAAASACD